MDYEDLVGGRFGDLAPFRPHSVAVSSFSHPHTNQPIPCVHDSFVSIFAPANALTKVSVRPGRRGPPGRNVFERGWLDSGKTASLKGGKVESPGSLSH